MTGVLGLNTPTRAGDLARMSELPMHKVFAAIWPQGNNTTVGNVGCAVSGTGTVTARNWASTNLYSRTKALDVLVTVAASTAVAGMRIGVSQFTASDGFRLVYRWGQATGTSVSTKRGFCGMRAAAGAPTDVQPSSITDMVGMGWDAADSNIQFMTNDSSGTATKVDTGIARPSADATDVYEIELYAPPGGASILWTIKNLTTGAIATGSATTDLPTSTTALQPMCCTSVGGTSGVTGVTVFTMYCESES
jgi:hypothetical protein